VTGWPARSLQSRSTCAPATRSESSRWTRIRCGIAGGGSTTWNSGREPGTEVQPVNPTQNSTSWAKVRLRYVDGDLGDPTATAVGGQSPLPAGPPSPCHGTAQTATPPGEASTQYRSRSATSRAPNSTARRTRPGTSPVHRSTWVPPASPTAWVLTDASPDDGSSVANSSNSPRGAESLVPVTRVPELPRAGVTVPRPVEEGIRPPDHGLNLPARPTASPRSAARTRSAA